MKKGLVLGFFFLFAVRLSAQQDSCTHYYRVQPIQYNGNPMTPGKWSPDKRSIERELEIQKKGLKTLKFEICDTLVCPPKFSGYLYPTQPEDFRYKKPTVFNPWHIYAIDPRRDLFPHFF